jgi:hypothetical protein
MNRVAAARVTIGSIMPKGAFLDDRRHLGITPARETGAQP